MLIHTWEFSINKTTSPPPTQMARMILSGPKASLVEKLLVEKFIFLMKPTGSSYTGPERYKHQQQTRETWLSVDPPIFVFGFKFPLEKKGQRHLCGSRWGNRLPHNLHGRAVIVWWALKRGHINPKPSPDRLSQNRWNSSFICLFSVCWHKSLGSEGGKEDRNR